MERHVELFPESRACSVMLITRNEVCHVVHSTHVYSGTGCSQGRIQDWEREGRGREREREKQREREGWREGERERQREREGGRERCKEMKREIHRERESEGER